MRVFCSPNFVLWKFSQNSWKKTEYPYNLHLYPALITFTTFAFSPIFTQIIFILHIYFFLSFAESHMKVSYRHHDTSLLNTCVHFRWGFFFCELERRDMSIKFIIYLTWLWDQICFLWITLYTKAHLFGVSQ